MSRLFKFALLLLFLNTFVFADRYYYYFLAQNNQPKKYSYTGDINSYIRVGNDIFKSRVIDNIEYLNSQDNYDKSSVFYRFGNDNAKAFIFLNQQPKKVGCWAHYGHDSLQNKADCDEPWYKKSDSTKLNLHAFKFLNLEKVATCQPDEHFNTETKQCQKCPEGYSWNPATNKCYKDCSDAKKNMYGWDDGSCTDCSHAKTTADVYKCFCGRLGLGVPNQITDTGFPNGGKCVFRGTCSDGYKFDYTDPECKEDKDPKPDDNSTKPQDPDTPKPDNNNTKPKPDNPNGPGNNNNPNNPNNPNGPGKDTNNTNPNGPKPGGPSGPGGGGGGDNDGKDKDAKFNEGDFDDGGADKERDGLFGDIKDHINSNLSKFDGISQGITQFIDNVKGKGFDKVQTDIKRKCPIAKELPLPGGNSKPIIVDYCDIVSPVSEVTYYAFYIGFAAGGFLLFLKLLLLSF